MRVDFETFYYEEIDRIGHLVLNNLPGNIMSYDFFDSFNRLFRNEIRYEKIDGIYIQTLGRHFSSGADIEHLRQYLGKNVKVNESGEIICYAKWFVELQNTGQHLKKLKVPVISGMNGICYGSGLELGLWSHIRICGKNSLLCLPEVTFHYVPGWGGTQNLPEIIGIGKSTELILSGKTINAIDALKLGIVNKVVETKEVKNEALKIIEYINNTRKIYSNKKIWNQLLEI